MLYVLYGNDEFRRSEALRTLRRELDKDGNLAINTVTFEKLNIRSLGVEELRAATHTASFFAEERLVIIEGLLGRFGGARGRGRRGRNATSDEPPASGERDGFMDVLTNLPETTSVILVEEGITEPTAKSVPSAEVRGFTTFRRKDDYRRWAVQRAKDDGANFAPGSLDRLISLFDAEHVGELASEMEKLAVHANGRPITSEDIDELVSGALAYQHWDLTDAVIEGRVDRALGVLHRMGEKDHPPQLLTFMLVRQYRQILLAQALLREGASQAEVGSQLGLQNYPLQKVVEQATRYPVQALEAAYRRLLENDVAVKTGVIDAATGLEILVVSLAELARAPRRPAASRR